MSRTVGLLLLLTLTPVIATDDDASGGKAAADNGIFFVHAGELPSVPQPDFWSLPGRVLRNNPMTGIALEVAVPAGWSAETRTTVFDQPLEILVIDGQLRLAGRSLGARDYLRVPGGHPLTPPQSDTGSRLLLFGDKSPLAGRSAADTKTHDGEIDVVRYAGRPWVAGTAMKAAGRDDVPLKIKHYKNDLNSGARTYLVSVAPGLSIPWEVHDVAEEAYVLEGDYTLPECLGERVKKGRYTRGGYFYRPAGIAHNGPESGSQTGVVMLIRTPGPLTVQLVDGC